MKSFVALASLLVLVSLACSASRSAGSERPVSDNAPGQSPSTTSNPNQEKQPCTLKLAGAPAINDLRLGMTADEVLALFPGSKDDAEVNADLSRPRSPLGISSLLIRPAKFGSKDKYAGTSQISFALLDGRVSSFTIGYNGPQYSHVDQFVEKVIATSNLPPLDRWEGYVGMDNTLKLLKCSEFEASVSVGGPGGSLNSVSLKDLVADKALKDRRAKARAQASPTPKQ